MPADQAIGRIRQARPGSIETGEQEAYVANIRSLVECEKGQRLAGRRLGCLLGGAVGDAFGYPVEFDRWPAIKKRFGDEGLLKPETVGGQLVVSDDTQMTLFTLEGGLEGLSLSPLGSADVILPRVREAYLDWLATQTERPQTAKPIGKIWRYPIMQQRRAPGNTCLSALYAGGWGTPNEPIKVRNSGRRWS